MNHLDLALLALLCAACDWEPAPRPPATTPVLPPLLAEHRAAAESALAQDCALCHTLDLIQSQRLSRAQWDKEVKKMTGWGAPVAEEEGPLLGELLAHDFPSDGPPPEGVEISLAAALAKVEPDATAPVGDARRGRAAYRQSCAICHGQGGEGILGPALLGKPVVYRARDFAEVVSEGRGRMPAFAGAISPSDISNVRAFLFAHVP